MESSTREPSLTNALPIQCFKSETRCTYSMSKLNISVSFLNLKAALPPNAYLQVQFLETWPYFLTYETEFVLFLAVLKNSVLLMD